MFRGQFVEQPQGMTDLSQAGCFNRFYNRVPLQLGKMAYPVKQAHGGLVQFNECKGEAKAMQCYLVLPCLLARPRSFQSVEKSDMRYRRGRNSVPCVLVLNGASGPENSSKT